MRKLRPLVISYPNELKNAQAKKAYKHKRLKENPETLRGDFTQTGTNITITNLLFYTDHTEAWHRALCTHYTHRWSRARSSHHITVQHRTGSWRGQCLKSERPFSLQEVELIEFKEIVLSNLLPTEP